MDSKSDSFYVLDSHLVEVVDKEWAKDSLPADDIAIPQIELPDPDPEDGNAETSLKAIEKKWADLALQRISNQ